MTVNLIICNGAYKSGSTWVEKIVREVVDADAFSDHYKDRYQFDSLNMALLDEFLRSNKSGLYVTKAHDKNPGAIRVCKKYANIKVIMITRDPRAVFFSYYHHFCRTIGISLPVVLFYYTFGKFKVAEIACYNNAWSMEEDVLWLNYEDLIVSPIKNIEKICNFIGVKADVKSVFDNTTLSSLRKKESNIKKKNFFRSGEVDEWKGAVPWFIATKIRSVYARPGPITRFFSWIIFDVRRKLTVATLFRGV